ncbi:bifunctional [glutamate--ammonia ligase]-adenylyl-L-tyrosine phosphorylase/[glutamate--ammonia-ligase] adenylyltransferase [Methylomonas paludis]|uniref:Bifunctional glutamine synthetase adenylyltransferase/adenylyl-removing enzyme n=1 Tax=Methylomonas paludis TaxID=1173101 RepID=A0A975RB34_9GAMM|nr:bifunctional [glutamate--ammonia ligase]-adenylyl-L-tyrosine phosphorylase/[glutamate--ammonia-ligase] adenylyltransferase [Methylomonas paludis]QWF71871.1 bifunctional [glutamate--ammonia ligase]-adenylyl-L-tyrosine phosphorylase/[glutamate--ammonia-ligase] adenylyltransferase [Methylomonas paludis]
MTLFTALSKYSPPLPPALQGLAVDFCQRLAEKIPTERLISLLDDQPLFAGSILKVCCSSRFVADTWLRQPDLLVELLTSGDLYAEQRRDTYAADWQLSSQHCNSEAELAKTLRLFRRREMVRIAWRDLAGWADLDETLADLTRLAEICIDSALNFAYQQACLRWGTPRLADGRPFNLVVLGMGKLGAWELNFSSDIDLILAYAEDGVLTEKKEISYCEFFTRICRSMVKMLDAITEDGFVFRTDLRLRPFGDSGPLVMSFEGMEHYYLTQAREWERYAMIKARQVAGDFVSGKQLATLIKPFVYRRYLDYGAFEELRGLKFQIMQELKRKDRLENVKLGPGGIREVEFIGQAFQLIRGGQDVALQQREIQTVLTVLAELALMAEDEVAKLKFAYRFLRRVENHIQAYQDKQAHDLPTTDLAQQILAFSLDFSDWDSFKAELDCVRHTVHGIFDQVFSLTDQDSKQHTAQLLWASSTDDPQAMELLADYGFANPDWLLAELVAFKDSTAIKRMSSKGLAALQRLLPALLGELVKLDNQQVTLNRILTLFEAIAGRNVYLALLAENPDSLTQLLKLCSASVWICEYLAHYPILFDELLDARTLYEPLHKEDLRRDLQRELDKLEQPDSEQLMIVLRQFKHLNVLRVAAADIMGVIPVMVVSDYLTWIAEVILEQVVNSAWRLLGRQYGFPAGSGEDPENFAVIAYGKFGGIELGYGSDLDLVFLHDIGDENAPTQAEKPISSSLFYLRLAQKIRHILDTKMLSGILYEVDLRLRPNGDSGLLVMPVAAYADYLLHQAWTWEHQALVRARFICGDTRLAERFNTVRTQVLTLNRDYQTLKTEVHDMRLKMRQNKLKSPSKYFDLKQSPGGIADIEFIVQFGILAQSAHQPELTTYSDVVRLLAALSGQGFIPAADAALLKQAYCSYRDYGHHQVLQGLPASADNTEFSQQRAEVTRLWQTYLE